MPIKVNIQYLNSINNINKFVIVPHIISNYVPMAVYAIQGNNLCKVLHFYCLDLLQKMERKKKKVGRKEKNNREETIKKNNYSGLET